MNYWNANGVNWEPTTIVKWQGSCCQTNALAFLDLQTKLCLLFLTIRNGWVLKIIHPKWLTFLSGKGKVYIFDIISDQHVLYLSDYQG